MIFFDALSYDFFQRALLMGGSMSVVCALVGIFIVMRREALMSHALANTSFLGVVLGLLLGTSVHIMMLVSAVIVAIIISYLQSSRTIPEDSLLEFFAQMTFALAVVGISFFSGYRVDLFQYLFGDILAVTSADMFLQLPIILLLLCLFLLFQKKFLQIILSRELAKAAGTPVFFYNTLFLVIVALVVAIGIKIIGVILISAFLVLPANTARLVATSFRSTQIWSIAVGVVGSTFGLFFSYVFDIPSGASIVLSLSVLLFLAFILQKLLRAVRLG